MSLLKIEPQIANSTANFSFGNVFASNFYYANGSPFGGSVKYTASATPPASGNNPGDQWFNTTSQILYEYINDGVTAYWVDVQSATVSQANAPLQAQLTGGTSNVSVAVNGNVSVNVAGTPNVVTVSTSNVTVTGNVVTNGNIVVSGNVITPYITTVAGSGANLVIDPDGLGDLVVSPATEVLIQSTLTSTSTTTGALVVSGGVGIAGNVYSGGLVTAANGLSVTNGATIAGSLASGNIAITGNLTVSGSTTLAGATVLQQSYEIVNNSTATPSGTVTYDFTNAGTYYHSAPSATWTVNVTNVALNANRIFVIAFLINQGATGYLPSAYQINGTVVSVKWLNGSAPTASSSKTDIVSLSCMYTGSTWLVYGQAGSYS